MYHSGAGMLIVEEAVCVQTEYLGTLCTFHSTLL